MKRIIAGILAGVVALSSTPNKAYALFGVGDVVFDPQSYGELITMGKTGLDQLKTAMNIYTTGKDTLQSVENVYQMFAHITNVSSLVAALSSLKLNVAMLQQAAQQEQMLRGYGLTTNLADKILNIINQTQFFKSNQTDFTANQLNTVALSRAGQIAAGQASYDAAVQRATSLNELKLAIGSNDPKASLDLAARGSIESAQATAENTQVLTTVLMADSQRDMQKQQIDQAWRASDEALSGAAKKAADFSAAGGVQLFSGQ